MQNTWVWVVIAIIILAGGYWWWQTSQVPVVPGQVSTTDIAGTDTSGTDVTGSVTVDTTVPMVATITYDGTSFSPQTVTIKKGGTVSWNNEGTSEMWVATAQHPNHTIYSGTSRTGHCPDTSKSAFDQCAGGNNYTFTFNKAGTWNYHDHLNATAFGSVTVVE